MFKDGMDVLDDDLNIAKLFKNTSLVRNCCICDISILRNSKISKNSHIRKLQVLDFPYKVLVYLPYSVD